MSGTIRTRSRTKQQLQTQTTTSRTGTIRPTNDPSDSSSSTIPPTPAAASGSFDRLDLELRTKKNSKKKRLHTLNSTASSSKKSTNEPTRSLYSQCLSAHQLFEYDAAGNSIEGFYPCQLLSEKIRQLDPSQNAAQIVASLERVIQLLGENDGSPEAWTILREQFNQISTGVSESTYQRIVSGGCQPPDPTEPTPTRELLEEEIRRSQ